MFRALSARLAAVEIAYRSPNTLPVDLLMKCTLVHAGQVTPS